MNNLYHGRLHSGRKPDNCSNILKGLIEVAHTFNWSTSLIKDEENNLVKFPDNNYCLNQLKKWQDSHDEKISVKLTIDFFNLILSCTKKMKGYENYDKTLLSFSDIFSIALTSFTECLDLYNINNRIPFTPFAFFHIRSSLYKYILENISITKFSKTNHHKKIFFNIKKILKDLNLSIENLNENEITEIAKELRVKKEEIKEMIPVIFYKSKSLNEKILNEQGDEVEKIELLSDCDCSDTENSSKRENHEEVIINKNEAKIKNKLYLKALKILDKNEYNLITQRYNYNNSKVLPFNKIIQHGKKISDEGLRLKEKKIIIKLQNFILKNKIKTAA